MNDRKLYVKVKNEFDADVIIPFYELEDHVENVDDISELSVSFIRLTDEEYEQLPDFEG